MSVESIVEAFARGLAQGFVQASSPLGETKAPVRKGRRRGPRAPSASRNAGVTVEHSAPSEPVQETLFEHPEMVAPPVTQAELERMERALRGESDGEHYVPGEGTMPWAGS